MYKERLRPHVCKGTARQIPRTKYTRRNEICSVPVHPKCPCPCPEPCMPCKGWHKRNGNDTLIRARLPVITTRPLENRTWMSPYIQNTRLRWPSQNTNRRKWEFHLEIHTHDKNTNNTPFHWEDGAYHLEMHTQHVMCVKIYTSTNTTIEKESSEWTDENRNWQQVEKEGERERIMQHGKGACMSHTMREYARRY